MPLAALDRPCFVVAPLSCFYPRAGDKLERSVQSLPTLPITLEEVEERAAKWRVSTMAECGQSCAPARFAFVCLIYEYGSDGKHAIGCGITLLR